ncbi:hypothetical protein CLOM_g14480 [Closterium sp. NIES-68]|nr:hypothetical protein CLOM_g14480 [Closterium sp. NIES-68]
MALPQHRRAAVLSYAPLKRRGAAGSVARVVGGDGRRADGRSLEESRPAFLRTKTVTQAAGSAYAEFGGTKVIVAVFGPRESRKAEQSVGGKGRLKCDVRIAPFATPNRNSNAQGLEERYASEVEGALLPAVQLHLFPKATLDVSVLLLQSGGADVAVMMTAAAMALADAGVHLHDLVTAAVVSVCRGDLLLDPSAEEERVEEGRVVVALMPSLSEVVLCSVTGNMSVKRVKDAVDLAIAGCMRLDEVVRATVRDEAAAAVM